MGTEAKQLDAICAHAYLDQDRHNSDFAYSRPANCLHQRVVQKVDDCKRCH